MNPSLHILYEDNHLLAVVKPAGTLAQGDATGDESILDQGKAYIKEKYQKPGEVFLGLVHRLDRPVSGVMLLARTSKAAGRLAEQFRVRSVTKIYYAVVEGVPAQSSATLTHRLIPGKAGANTALVESASTRTKEARLRYQIREQAKHRALIEVELRTGYKHQIRAQFAALGCPVVGDFRYDKRPAPAVVQRLHQGHAIALHAHTLTILHPTKKIPLTFTAPMPTYWPWVCCP